MKLYARTARAWQPSLVWQARHAGPVRQALFSPRGDRVISAGEDRAVRLWNAADGKPVKTIAHEGAVTGVGVSGDGLKLASAGADKLVRAWDLTSPKQAQRHFLVQLGDLSVEEVDLAKQALQEHSLMRPDQTRQSSFERQLS